MVAIVSGRERSDLQARVGIPGLVYAGNHGLEISGPGLVFVEPMAIGDRDSLEFAKILVARMEGIQRMAGRQGPDAQRPLPIGRAGTR